MLNTNLLCGAAVSLNAKDPVCLYGTVGSSLLDPLSSQKEMS